ncbi:hypothetical protein Mapa_012310 [Marchantia paleacea]|nr:hypothetical protein Mapa_012310 [Marchantia paleacea]
MGSVSVQQIRSLQEVAASSLAPSSASTFAARSRISCNKCEQTSLQTPVPRSSPTNSQTHKRESSKSRGLGVAALYDTDVDDQAFVQGPMRTSSIRRSSQLSS